MKDKAFIGSWIGTGLTTLSTVINAEVRDIISWVVTLIVGIITIAFTLYTWYKAAKKDGQITKEEVKELTDELNKIKNKEDH